MAIEDAMLTAVVGLDGRATITVQPLGQQIWTVQQVSPEMVDAPGNAVGNLRKNGALVAPFAPSGDALGTEPYIALRLGDVMTVEWSNCTPGSVGRAYLMYDNGVN